MVALVAALAVLGSTGWTAADAAHEHGQLDVAALAIASEADRAAVDDALDVAQLAGHLVDSNVVAGSNATCDGCSSRATSLGVVYVGHGDRIVVDNLATASSSTCSQCTAVAVSAQVVVLRGAETIVANNRSLAVNAACVSCTASAAAYQFVVLRDWLQAQADELAQGTHASLRPSAASTGSIESELRARLGPGASVTTHIDVRRG